MIGDLGAKTIYSEKVGDLFYIVAAMLTLQSVKVRPVLQKERMAALRSLYLNPRNFENTASLVVSTCQQLGYTRDNLDVDYEKLDAVCVDAQLEFENNQTKSLCDLQLRRLQRDYQAKYSFTPLYYSIFRIFSLYNMPTMAHDKTII